MVIRVIHARANNNGKKTLCEHVQRLNNYGLQSGHYRQSRAYSDPKWPVERVANWLVIPQSASTRGQNRPLAPSLGGGGPRSIVFRPTGRLYPAIVSHHAKNTALLQKPQIPNGQWRGSPIGQKFPNRHELKGKAGPQHPPRGPKHPQCSIFRPIRVTNSCWRLGTKF